MKVGYYKDDLEFVDADTVDHAAETFAEDNHEICEDSDHRFSLFVEDNKGNLYEIDMYVEYDPRYEISNIDKVN